MDILQITGIGLIGVILVISLKAQKPEISLLIALCTGIIIIITISSKLAAVFTLLGKYANMAGLDEIYIPLLIKAVGIAYITEFGSSICKDAGESSVASKIELAGKVIIAVLTVPIITSLIELIISILH